jgi:hypothetical protein
MAKKKPPNTVTHQVFLPDELPRKVTALANYGQADDFYRRVFDGSDRATMAAMARERGCENKAD